MTQAGECRSRPTVQSHHLPSLYLCCAHYTERNQLILTEEWVPGLSISHWVHNCSVADIDILAHD